MFSREPSRQTHKKISEHPNLTSASPSSKNFLLAFDSISLPRHGRRQEPQGLRRSVRVMLAAVALLVLFACARAARGQGSLQISPGVAVGSTSTVQTLSLTITSTGTLSAVQVLTGGVAGLDFSAAG